MNLVLSTLSCVVFFLGLFFFSFVCQVKWPASLQSLTFGQAFDQLIDTEGTEWPPTLTRLQFGGSFNREIQRVRWPASLQEITFGREFNQVCFCVCVVLLLVVCGCPG